MKANITIKIGCEAGSKYCGECKLIRHILDGSQLQKHACEVFTRKTRTGTFRSQELEREGDFFENTVRCQQCLDAEKPASEQISTEEVKKVLDDLRSSFNLSCENNDLLRMQVHDRYRTRLELLLNKTKD